MDVEVIDKGQDYLTGMSQMDDWTKGNSAQDFYFLAVIREKGFVNLEEHIGVFNRDFPNDYRQVARRLFESGNIEEIKA